jgi:hypothetical protein
MFDAIHFPGVIWGVKASAPDNQTSRVGCVPANSGGFEEARDDGVQGDKS